MFYFSFKGADGVRQVSVCVPATKHWHSWPLPGLPADEVLEVEKKNSSQTLPAFYPANLETETRVLGGNAETFHPIGSLHRRPENSKREGW